MTGSVRTAVQNLARRGEVLRTPSNPSTFVIQDTDEEAVTLLVGTSRTRMRLTWQVLDRALQEVQIAGVMRIGGTQGPAPLPNTLDAVLKRASGSETRTSNYVAPLFDAAGLASVKGGRGREPATISILRAPASAAAGGLFDWGEPYRTAEGGGDTRSGSLVVDLEHIDRATKEHARLQNEVAEFLEANGRRVLSPRNSPQFDLAWCGQRPQVCEVKTTQDDNEVQQIRLGLGQVLDYRVLMLEAEPNCGAVLALSREPKYERWQLLCDSVAVTLVWRGHLERLLEL